MSNQQDTSSIPDESNHWESETFERVDGFLVVVNKNKETVGSFTFTEKEDVELWQNLVKSLNASPLSQNSQQ